MISFSDITINECNGNFDCVNKLIKSEGLSKWMLKSNATVTSKDLLGNISISCNYILHFWNSGEVYIMFTDHPTLVDVPDDDIRELYSWCEQNGWKLSLNHLLIENTQGFDFWLRMYISGLVYSEELKKYEDQETDRILQFQQSENKDANNN